MKVASGSGALDGASPANAQSDQRRPRGPQEHMWIVKSVVACVQVLRWQKYGSKFYWQELFLLRWVDEWGTERANRAGADEDDEDDDDDSGGEGSSLSDEEVDASEFVIRSDDVVSWVPRSWTECPRLLTRFFKANGPTGYLWRDVEKGPILSSPANLHTAQGWDQQTDWTKHLSVTTMAVRPLNMVIPSAPVPGRSSGSQRQDAAGSASFRATSAWLPEGPSALPEGSAVGSAATLAMAATAAPLQPGPFVSFETDAAPQTPSRAPEAAPAHFCQSPLAAVQQPSTPLPNSLADLHDAQQTPLGGDLGMEDAVVEAARAGPAKGLGASRKRSTVGQLQPLHSQGPGPASPVLKRARAASSGGGAPADGAPAGSAAAAPARAATASRGLGAAEASRPAASAAAGAAESEDHLVVWTQEGLLQALAAYACAQADAWCQAVAGHPSHEGSVRVTLNVGGGKDDPLQLHITCVPCATLGGGARVAGHFRPDAQQPLVNFVGRVRAGSALPKPLQALARTFLAHVRGGGQHTTSLREWTTRAAAGSHGGAEGANGVPPVFRRASARNAGPRKLIGEFRGATGVAAFLDEVVHPTLGVHGALFQKVIDFVSQNTQQRVQAAKRHRAVVFRLLAVLALHGTGDGGGGRAPVEALQTLAGYLTVVRPVDGGTAVRAHVYLEGPASGSEALPAFVALLQRAFGTLQQMSVIRPPMVNCWSEAQTGRRVQRCSDYARRRSFVRWLLLVGLSQGDAADDDEAQGDAEDAVEQTALGQRAGVQSEYRTESLAMREMLKAVLVLVAAGYEAAAVRAGVRAEALPAGADGLPSALQDWFKDARRRLTYDVSASVHAAVSTRAMELDHHLGTLCQYVLRLKTQFYRCRSVLEDLLSVVTVTMSQRATELQDQHDARMRRLGTVGMELPKTQLRASLVRDVLEPMLLEPEVSRLISMGVVLVFTYLLAGQRPGWFLRCASTLGLEDGERSASAKLKGSVLWSTSGWPVIMATGDKTVRANGAGVHAAEQGQVALFLAELLLMATLSRAARDCPECRPVLAPTRGSSSHVKAPVLLQGLRQGGLRALLTKQKDLHAVMGEAYVFDFELFNGGRAAGAERFNWWADLAIVTMAGREAPQELPEAFEQACLGGDAPVRVPALVANTGMHRIAWAAVGTALADDRREQKQALADVQSHLLSTQQNVYTPNDVNNSRLAASAMVQMMVGADPETFKGRARTPAVQAALEELRKTVPGVHPLAVGRVLRCAELLGLGWVAPHAPLRSVKQLNESLGRNVARLVHQGIVKSLVLPSVVLPMALSPVHWPIVLLEHAHQLACETCRRILTLCDAPLSSNALWHRVGLAAPALLKGLPAEHHLELLQARGVLLCNGCLSLDSVTGELQCATPIQAIIVTNKLVLTSLTGEEAIRIWPQSEQFLKQERMEI